MKLRIKNRICIIEKKEILLSGNVNTYSLEIEYDSIYDGRQLIVYFKNDDVKKISPVSPNNKVIIPYEVLEKTGRLYIGVFSPNSNDNTLIDRYCSNFEDLKVMEGAYDKEATYTEELSPSILEQYLQEMKNFYNESLKEYNKNAELRLKEYNDNADLKLSEYNNNSSQKVREYNENAHLKKEEIDKVSEEVKKDKSDIEAIEKRVSVSENNAKTSENNAKTSEQNAQKSAENALKVLSDVTNIQKDINASKTHVDNQKESVDNSVVKIEKMVEEATNQANISKKQAELSTTNAAQTSADRTAVEAIKSDVSSMKLSVEQTKNDTEQIKTDTQAIFDNTVQAKNETLEAKENVENSLESERIESDKKYARSIDTDEIEISEYGEVELDEGGYMKDVEISTAKGITQDTRVGYNKLNLEKYPYSKGQSVLNGSTVALNNGILSIDATNATADVTIKSKSLAGANRDIIPAGKYYFGVNTNGYYKSNPEKLVQLTQGIVDVSENYYLSQWYTTCKINEKIDKKLLLSDDVSKTEYEKFGASPSIEFPSKIKNIESNIKINNHQSNCLNNQIKSQTLNGVKLELNEDGSVHISGTATARIEPHIWDKASINDELVLKKGKEYFNYTGRTLYFNVRKNTYLTIANGKSYIPDEDLSIEYYVYIRIEKDETVDETIYPFLTTQKDSKYEKFNGNLKKVELGNNFLGSFKGYKNYIEKNRFKRNLNILNLTGSEKWQAHINSDYLKTPDESLDFFIQVPSDMKTGSIMLCDKFKFFNFDGGYRVNSNIESVSSGGGYRRIYIRIKKDRLDSSDANGLKKFLKELYEKGDPVKILYITNTEYDEELFAEILDKLNSLKVYNGINQIDIDNFKLKFKSNRNLQNYIDDQIKLNSSEEIKKYDSRYAKALKIQVDDVKKTKIYVENSQVEELKIEGEEITQNKRLGYNLLINKLTSKTVKGVTFDVQEDGSIILNGTPTETIVINLLTGNESISDVAADSQILKIPDTITKMTLSGCPKNGQSKAFKIDLWSKSGELIGNDSDFGSGIKIDFSSNENWRKINRARIVIYTFAKLNNTVFRPMLAEGTGQKTYEKYGASPSVNFPSKFENVLKNINLNIANADNSKICNKQLELSQNQFLGSFNSFKNYIKNGKLYTNLKILEFDGTENWQGEKTEKGYRFKLNVPELLTANKTNANNALCTHFNIGYTGGTWNAEKVFTIYRVVQNNQATTQLAFGSFSEITSVNDWKAKLKELHEAGNPLKVLAALYQENEEELTEENKKMLNSFEFFEDENNIEVAEGFISFKYNKSIQKVLEEKDDKINDLQNQINEIKALLNTTNTASFLAENLAIDNESEVI